MPLVKEALIKALQIKQKLRNSKLPSTKSSSFFKRRGFLLLLIFLFSSLLLTAAFALQNQMRILKKKEKRLSHDVRKLKHQAISAECLGGIPIPQRLAGIPFAEDSGLVLDVKTIEIRNVTAPHNPSLIQTDSGYDLFFRYDKVNSNARYVPYFSHIGAVSLDQNFSQGSQEFQKIELPTNYSEDPRALRVGEKLFLVFNILDIEVPSTRLMCLAHLDPTSRKVHYMTPLDMNLEWQEKNWPPFEYVGEDQKPVLFFEYQISPHKILSLPNPEKNELFNIILPRKDCYLPLSLVWEDKWGKLRGGTPALKIGDEYLAFFHSAFTEKGGFWWYIMGAYTFKAKPPFSLTGISKYPILFRGVFENPVIHTADRNKRVIYPSGFVIENRDGKELIHLACGENDCAVKIVTLDKKILLETMNRFDE